MENGGEEAANEDTSSSKSIAGNGQSATALEKLPQKALTYYGSAARRQLRRNSPKESERAVPLPDWFVDSQVHLQESLKRQRTDSTIQWVHFSPTQGWVGHLIGEPDEVSEALRSQHRTKESKDISGQDHATSDSAAREPVPLSGKRYFVDFPQWAEVGYTINGLMKLPHPNYAGEVASEKSHLILHYPAEGGSYLLDELVENMSQRMKYDLISLDAQDISELVASSPEHIDAPPEEFMQTSRLMSYEVYHKDSGMSEDMEIDDDEDGFDFERQGESSSRPKGYKMGTPMIIAKPITMNLSDLLGGVSSSSRGRSRTPKSFFGGLNGEIQQRPKSPKHMLANLVDAMVSAPSLKRAAKSGSNSGDEVSDGVDATEQSSISSEDPAPSHGLVIHVKDLRAIQDTQFGKQFLSALYENVQNRRTAREKVIIIGTETSNDEASSYSKGRIQGMQNGELDEISRTILLTPVTPNTDAKLALLEDKKRRIRTINLRHFWEQYRQKDLKALGELPEQFWKLDPVEYIHTSDWSMLESSVMSFGQIHRLASLMAGMASDRPYTSKSLQLAIRHLSASDKVKMDWAEQGRSKESSRSDGSEKSSDSRINKLRRTATKHEKRLLGGVIEPDKIKTTFNDVHAPVETIDALKTLTTLSLVRPEAFLYGVLASDKIPGLLLYGPPGTGKTLLAKAVAKESGATVLEVSAAEINDMYVGEGEKNVKALFSLAKKLSPCVSPACLASRKDSDLFNIITGHLHRRSRCLVQCSYWWAAKSQSPRTAQSVPERVGWYEQRFCRRFHNGGHQQTNGPG